MRRLALLAAAAAEMVTMLAGCGTPGAPSPPSLKLPVPVTNLTAARTGNQVALAWTMPRKNTDKLAIKGDIAVRVCRVVGPGGVSVGALAGASAGASGCALAGSATFAAGAKAAFVDALPAALASGAPRPLSYFVELTSPRGRTAGPSNVVAVLAGEAPAAVAGLSAQLRKDGVVLHWAAESAAGPTSGSADAIRLHRRLLTVQGPGASGTQPDTRAGTQPDTQAGTQAGKGMLGPEKEPVEQTLLVEPGGQPALALDKTIRFGATYEYRAQRVARSVVDGQTVELAGPLSAPIRVEAIDTFPPAVPGGLAAVATAASPDAGPAAAAPAIDLSWLPDTEPDLAGYAVYRRESQGGGKTAWVRISPAEPVVGPAFHDAHVEPGHAYHYAVTAIDKLGHESGRSDEATETVPNP